MGRYSTVQAYADNSQNARSISYEQATGGGDAAVANKQVVTEKVSNPYGSTAGAGSGEFHVYRHARAREAARWKELDESEQQTLKLREFEQQLQDAKAECEKKTEKNRKKRQREKEAKSRKKHLTAAGIVSGITPNSTVVGAGEDEFSYNPEKDRINETERPLHKENDESMTRVVAAGVPPVEELPNDGSFLEIMKMKLQQTASNDDSPSNGNGDGDQGPMPPPRAKKLTLETRIIDEDDEEGLLSLR